METFVKQASKAILFTVFLLTSISPVFSIDESDIEEFLAVGAELISIGEDFLNKQDITLYDLLYSDDSELLEEIDEYIEENGWTYEDVEGFLIGVGIILEPFYYLEEDEALEVINNQLAETLEEYGISDTDVILIAEHFNALVEYYPQLNEQELIIETYEEDYTAEEFEEEPDEEILVVFEEIEEYVEENIEYIAETTDSAEESDSQGARNSSNRQRGSRPPSPPPSNRPNGRPDNGPGRKPAQGQSAEYRGPGLWQQSGPPIRRDDPEMHRRVNHRPPLNFGDFVVEADIDQGNDTLNIYANFGVDNRIKNFRIKAVGSIVRNERILVGGLLRIANSSESPNGMMNVNWNGISLSRIGKGTFDVIIVLRTMQDEVIGTRRTTVRY
jgi:hypothetical protein